MGALKNSPGGCTCCPACGVVSLPATLNFTIAGIAAVLSGPGGTSGTWQTGTKIHAPGTEVTNCFPIVTAPYVEVNAAFHLLAAPNTLGQCFSLQLQYSWILDKASCTAENFQSFSTGLPGCGGYSAGGLATLQVTGVLNSYTWSPFSSAWTFPTTWDGSPTRGTVPSLGSCFGATVAVGLAPALSGAATLTH